MNKPNETGGTARLLEIMGILRKHNVIMGVSPEKLRLVVEDLGPTFVKLGQILSMRPDILPLAYCDELQKLRSDVTPMPADEVTRVIETSLGMAVSEAFPTFDLEPLGSASIAQAHRATLPCGASVVVKVQREGIYAKMASDITLLRKATKLLKLTPTGETIDFAMVLSEMWTVSQQEMNFLSEAENAEEFARLNEGIAYVAFPAIYKDISTREVLVMEAIEGFQIDDQPALIAAGYDMAEISRKLCVNYMKQILDDGFFHADPHPGNLRIRDGQIVWLDMGMVGRLSAKDQAAFKKAMTAVAAHDIGALMEAILAISKHTAPVDREALYADVDAMLAEYVEMDLGSINIGELMQHVLDLAQKHRLSLPPGVTMLGRGVSTLEGLIADISPDVNVMEIVSQRFAHTALRDIDLKQTVARDAQAVYESVQKSLSSPALLNDALRAALKGELKLRVDEQPSQASAQAQIVRADRLRRAMLASALFVGASLMTLSPVEPKWFGLPWVSVVGFVLAAGFPVWGWWREKRRK